MAHIPELSPRAARGECGVFFSSIEAHGLLPLPVFCPGACQIFLPALDGVFAGVILGFLYRARWDVCMSTTTIRHTCDSALRVSTDV